MEEKGGERGGGEEGGEWLLACGQVGGEGGALRKGEEAENTEGIVKGAVPWGGVETHGEGGVEQEIDGREAVSEIKEQEEEEEEESLKFCEISEPPIRLRRGGGEEGGGEVLSLFVSFSRGETRRKGEGEGEEGIVR